MKKSILISALCYGISCGLSIAQNPWANRVVEFLPAPGQFTNEKAYPAYMPGDDAMTMAQKATVILQGNASAGTGNNMSTISLGAYGGYIIAGFDHPVLNKPYAYDLKIHGNWFDGNAESGIVLVSKDANKNGLADDAWYELAGSQYYDPTTIHNYEMTYYRPSPLDGNVRWTDNQGKTGFVLRNSYHLQESYYPLWYDGDKLIFKGTKLISNAWNTALPPQQYWRSESFTYGYADNQGNNSELSNFDIDWAVDVNGNKVTLDHIDFVKVYTGLIQDAGWLGETSTEFSQAQDLHPTYAFPPVFLSDIHTVKKLPALAPSSAWTGDGSTSFSDDTVTFQSFFDGGVLTDGFTYTNQITGAYASASGKGVNNTSYVYGTYDVNAADHTNRLIRFNDGLPHGLEGMYVNNAAASLSLLKQRMETGDYVNLVAIGFDANGNEVARTSFPLASYESLNSVMYYAVEQWCWMDLHPLGSVFSFVFSFDVSRSEITPAAFCLDQLTIDILSITQQPAGNPNGSPKLCEGTPYVLRTGASGSNITYQWYKNDAVIAGAVSAELPFNSLLAENTGTYYCKISNGMNTARTDAVPLVVYKNTRIIQNLPGGTVHVPQVTPLTISIKAEGDKLVYQWYKGNLAIPKNPYTLVAIGLNSTSKSPDFIPAPYGFITDYEGFYYCQITGVCGNLRTDTTAYKVVANPELPSLVIVQQPKDTTVCFGSTIVMGVNAPAATGYSWMKKNISGAFSVLGASTKQQVTIPNLIADGEYRCTVKQDALIKYTDTVLVTVVQKLAFVQPEVVHLGSYTAIQHKPLKMEVSALDFIPVAYQWYYKSLSDIDFQLLSGVTTATFTIDYPLPADAGKYRCVVTGAAGKSQIEYNLSVVSSIAEQPYLYYYESSYGMDGDIREGGLFEAGEHVRITAYALDGYTFKWYKDNVEVIVPEENMLLADDESVTSGYWTMSDYPTYLMIKDIQKDQAGSYVFETINENGEVEERSEPILIIMDPEKPEILNMLQNTVVDEDATLKLMIQADGKGFTPAYQWYHNGVALMGDTKSPYVTNGPTKAAFDLIVKPSSAGTYFCVVTTPGGSAVSNSITVSIQRKVRILSHPSDQIVQAGKAARVSILAEGSGIQYQWKKNGIALSGKTSTSLTITNVALSDEGIYSCVVTAPGLVDAESGAAGLAVIDKPIISGNVACLSPAKLSVQPQLKPVQVRYQWFRDNQALTGATYSWIQLKQTSGDLSKYYCLVTNSIGVSSDTVSLIHTPAISVQPKAETIVNVLQTVVLATIATGQDLSYQWFFEGGQLTGETAAQLTFTAQQQFAGNYTCTVSNACGDVISNEAVVRVDLATDVLYAEALSQVLVYPNPAETMCTIAAPEGSIIEIFDLTGRKLFSAVQSTDKMDVAMNTMNSGIYMVTIQYKERSRTLKLIKK